ncbi:MAG: hypothetical protein IPF81_17650 [Bacteroidetes bacterium]|nr:hypothetical protein [Bacteroidota bacterium]
MLRYGQWMDEFIEVIAIQKKRSRQYFEQPSDDASFDRKRMATQLTTFLKDEKFALIYRASIERMTNEIA